MSEFGENQQPQENESQKSIRAKTTEFFNRHYAGLAGITAVTVGGIGGEIVNGDPITAAFRTGVIFAAFNLIINRKR